MVARIPVFVSAPTSLSAAQQRTYDFIIDLLAGEELEPRALGRSDFGVDYPLKEVYSIARHCSGGIILGFAQMRATDVLVKPGTPDEKVRASLAFPTPWNNLEAGILFGLKLPLMVFREEGIEGGVFDYGVSDLLVQNLPADVPDGDSARNLRLAIKNWVGKVREHYRVY
ncbi:hypothetical protein ACFUEJ_22520 [Gordonia sp. NPDC057258]|uniref:hypothetical protein n=1 Tax=unclassified Gordonia (in: high G+C Gram-positive bacteria) TaxID=2657482 RepID=UPI0036454FBA